jgi:hypothetical protein
MNTTLSIKERLQAVIISRIAFHPEYCWNLEHWCNEWMGCWDCWRGFRHYKNTETKLTSYYSRWFIEMALATANSISTTRIISECLDNLYLLATLPENIQIEIYERHNNPYISSQLLELFEQGKSAPLPALLPIGEDGGVETI